MLNEHALKVNPVCQGIGYQFAPITSAMGGYMLFGGKFGIADVMSGITPVRAVKVKQVDIRHIIFPLPGLGCYGDGRSKPTP